MALLKDLYSPQFYHQLSGLLVRTVPGFDKDRFMKQIFSPGWEQKELKERMRHTSQTLHHFLPARFENAASILMETVRELQEAGTPGALEYMFLPDYIEHYGINDLSTAADAIEMVTQFVSCEFAVRPFLLRYGKEMMDRMVAWSLHPDHRVRRLASEGSRPRLPWAVALPHLKKDPSPTLPILENLKNDPHQWVRRSVANHLNDISRDHPAIVLRIARDWKGISRETDAILRHACRTLLKKGDVETLQHFGLEDHENIHVTQFRLESTTVQVGDTLRFSFGLHNRDEEARTVRMEYGIYYLRGKGQYNRKVFKISERSIAGGEQLQIQRGQSFRPITTRRFYPGTQAISIIINGKEKVKKEFTLL